MATFEEYENPDFRFLPKDPDAPNQKCYEASRQFDILPNMSGPLTGAYAILGKEETLGQKLGDSSADDILYLARRVKKLRSKISDLREIIDMIYDVKYCGKPLEEVAKAYIKLQKEKQVKIA